MPGLGAGVDALENAVRGHPDFRAWLRSRRWCGEALGRDAALAIEDRARLVETEDEVVVFLLAVAREGNAATPMHLPLAVSAAKPEPEAFELAVGRERFYVTEGERSAAYARFLVDGFRDGRSLRTVAGDALQFAGDPIGAFRAHEPRAEDSSNLLVRIATAEGEVVFKSYKLLDVHNREPEILERLRAKGFPGVPRLRGVLALGTGAERLVLGIATDRVDAIDAFSWFTAGWREEVLGTPGRDFERASLGVAALLGEATAALHDALLDARGPFQGEPFSPEDAEAATKAALSYLSDSLRRLAALAKGSERRLADLTAKSRALVFDHRTDIEAALGGLAACVGTTKGVTHADLHLGQVLRTSGGDLLFIDFEGEPERAPGDRSAKLPFLRDVATMHRSFAYVKHYAWREAIGGDATAAWRFLQRQDRPPEREAIARRLAAWESAATERFTRAYLARARMYESVPPEQALRAIRGWAMEKALYELRYELKHRPQNIFIPLEGVLSLAAA